MNVKTLISKSYCVLFGLLSVSTLCGATSTWTNSAGGDFLDSSNWSGEVPAGDDRASINASGSYEITLSDDHSVGQLRLDNGSSASKVTFNLGGKTLTTTSAVVADAALYLRPRTGESRYLEIQNGTLAIALARIGDAAGETEMVVRDGGVLRMMTISGSQDHRVGRAAQSTLKILDGGLLEVDSSAALNFGLFNGEGILEVRGENARADVKSRTSLGVFATTHPNAVGRILITEAAKAEFADIWVGSGSEGHLEVNDGANLTMDGLIVGRSGGKGHAVLTSGADVEAVSIDLGENGILEIDDASVTVSSQSSGTWEAGSIYRLYLNGTDADPLSLHSANIESTLDVRLGEDFVAELGAFYTVIDYTGALVGNFLDGEGNILEEDDSITIGDYTFDLHYGGRMNGGIVSLELVAIPEPGTSVLGVAILSLLVVMIRCRKSK